VLALQGNRDISAEGLADLAQPGGLQALDVMQSTHFKDDDVAVICSVHPNLRVRGGVCASLEQPCILAVSGGCSLHFAPCARLVLS
jgi:hypothetical protein